MTPNNLDQLVKQLLSEAYGPLEASRDRMKAILRDYLAQKFQAAMLFNPDAVTILQALFNRCVEEADNGTKP